MAPHEDVKRITGERTDTGPLSLLSKFFLGQLFKLRQRFGRQARHFLFGG